MMESKKVIQYGMIGIVLGIFIISIASAGLLDSVKRAFGKEPQLGPFNASLTLTGIAPSIIFVNVSDNLGSSGVNEVNPEEGTGTNVNVTFIANDPNSNTELPTGTVPIGTSPGNIFLRIIYGGTRAENFNYTAQNGVDFCQSLLCSPPECTTSQRKYECVLRNIMQFYYQPNTAGVPAYLWSVNVTIRDTTGLVGENTTRNFSYLQLPSVRNIVNLTFLSVNPTLQNITASDNVTMVNRGNVARTRVQIRAFNLTGPTYPANPINYIPSEAIFSNGTVGYECRLGVGGRMVENADANVTGFNLDYNSSSYHNLRFCIIHRLDTTYNKSLTGTYFRAVGQSYATDGTKDWEMLFP